MTKKKNGFKFSDLDFDDLNLDEIDINKIGNSIKNSINSTLEKINISKKSKENLPQTRNEEVCAQKPPELSKARGWKFLSVFAAFMLVTLDIVLFDRFITERGFFLFLMCLCSGLLTIAIPVLSRKAGKEYLRLTNNYVRFLRELGNNTVISIRDLASSVAQSEEKTISDLTKMMKRGYFYQARIVENDTMFILDIPTFRLYKDKRKDIPVIKIKEDDTDEEALVEDLSFQRASEILNSGKIVLEEIKNTKNKISNSDFKSNVEKLIKNSSDILNIVEKYPDKSYALNKFSDYYLPTTAKLINTYYDFELMATDDKKIKTSMSQIDSSIVTITEAFDKIKVELLSDRAMDIKTDIDTINLLLNQEGLAEDDWKYEE